MTDITRRNYATISVFTAQTKKARLWMIENANGKHEPNTVVTHSVPSDVADEVEQAFKNAGLAID